MSAFLNHLEHRLSRYEPRSMGQQRRFVVLLPLIFEKGEWQIVYEVRSNNISQPGEVAFPGGAIEEGECPSDAAIRETSEELGIALENINLLGEFDYVVTDNSIIYCYIGYLNQVTCDELNSGRAIGEVAEVFSLSLNWLKDHPPSYYYTNLAPIYRDGFPVNRLPGGKSYRWSRREMSVAFYDDTPDSHNLWGITAKFTDRFIQFVNEENDEILGVQR